MADWIEATFYEDGSVFVNNHSTGIHRTFRESAPLRDKLEALGIDSVSESEVQRFRDGWNAASRVEDGGSKVERALKYAFGVDTRTDVSLPTEVGSVVNVDMGYEILVVTLGADQVWREGATIYSTEEILEEAEEITVIA